MPIYEYRCTSCGAELEKLQKISDSPLVECPECGKDTLVKLVSASSFRLKGSGWYETDFKTGKKKNGAGDSADAAPDSASAATAAAANETKAASNAGAGDNKSAATESKTESRTESGKEGGKSKDNSGSAGKSAPKE